MYRILASLGVLIWLWLEFLYSCFFLKYGQVVTYIYWHEYIQISAYIVLYIMCFIVSVQSRPDLLAIFDPP